MAYREFDQPKVGTPESVDFGVLGRILGGVDKFPHHLIGGDGKGKTNKRPSYKIDTAKAAFSGDQEDIGNHVNSAIDIVGQGGDPTARLQQAEYIANTTQAQKAALDQYKAQLNELQQVAGPDATDPTVVNDLANSAYNHKTRINTRGEIINNIAKQFEDPSQGLVNVGKYNANNFLKLDVLSPTYTDKDEQGNVNIGTERKVTGRLLVPDTKRPQFEGKNGKKVPAVDANGQPIYELRQAETVDEVMPLVNTYFDTNANTKWTVNKVAREEKDKIDQLTADWVSSERNRPDGGVPSKEVVEAKKKLIARDLAKQQVAKEWLQLERPTTVLNNTRTVDEPRQPSAGSMDRFTMQTASSSSQQNLVRQRTSKMSDGTTRKKTDTYTYHTPMKSVSILDDKGVPLKVSIANVSGTNETTGREFASAQTVESAPLNGLNFAIGSKRFRNGKEYIKESNMSAENSKDWHDGVNKRLTVENIKKELISGNDPIIYPWAEVSVPKRKNDFTDLSSKDRAAAERLQELSKITSSDMTEDERNEYATLHVKYNEYIDHNLSTDASNIPQLSQYAKKKGFQNVSQMLQASMTPAERTKFKETSALLEKNKAIARKEIEAEKKGKSTTQPKYSSIQEDAINHVMSKNKGATREQVIDALTKAGKLK